MADNKDIIYDAKSVEMAKNAIRDPKALEKYRDKQDKAKKAKGQLISEWLWCLQLFKQPSQKFDEFLP